MPPPTAEPAASTAPITGTPGRTLREPNPEKGHPPRPVRAAIPVLVSFSASSFTIRDFTVNMSEGGIFLATENVCPKGTQGSMKFRVSQFDEPFTLKGEVMWVVTPGEEEDGQHPGMGIRFLDASEADLGRLRQIVEGVVNGSVVATIRKSIREGEKGIDQELRGRPTDQKMMLAINATGEEINALIRDCNPSVLTRLLECPRLSVGHVQAILRHRNLPTSVLAAVRKARKWMLNEEVRWLFCTHPSAMISQVVEEMRMLSRGRLTQLARNMNVKVQVRSKAAEMCKKQGARRT